MRIVKDSEVLGLGRVAGADLARVDGELSLAEPSPCDEFLLCRVLLAWSPAQRREMRTLELILDGNHQVVALGGQFAVRHGGVVWDNAMARRGEKGEVVGGGWVMMSGVTASEGCGEEAGQMVKGEDIVAMNWRRTRRYASQHSHVFPLSVYESVMIWLGMDPGGWEARDETGWFVYSSSSYVAP